MTEFSLSDTSHIIFAIACIAMIVYLPKFVLNKGFDIDFDKCINNKEIEDFVLNDRIEGAKNFKVNATPTIIINNEKFEKSLNYKNLKKSLEKLI